MQAHRTLIVIHGPTAVGKTSIAIQLAQLLKTEILSTDSRQFYREMSIGTAKPTEAEMAQVPHHFIDNRLVSEYYSAGDFERDALLKIEELFGSGYRHVIAVGGSGLYIKALCEGLDEMPKADLELRNFLIEQHKTHGITWLQQELEKLDPQRFALIDRQNPQRLMRAIELHHQGGMLKTPKIQRPFQILKVGLELPREELYERINRRVDLMMEQGLLEEVKALLPLENLNALQTVGYKEIFDYLHGRCTLPRAVELIKQHSRNYAKRQMTWFRADPDIVWFNPGDFQSLARHIVGA